MSELYNILTDDITLSVIIAKDKEVYLKFNGFEDQEIAEEFGIWLAENATLIFYESQSLH